MAEGSMLREEGDLVIGICRGSPFPAPRWRGLVGECGQVGGVADAKTS